MDRHGQAVPPLSLRALACGRGPVIRMKSEGKRQNNFLAVATGEGDAGWVEHMLRLTLTFLGPRGGLLVPSALEWQPHHLTPVQSSLCQSQMALSPSARARATFQARAALEPGFPLVPCVVPIREATVKLYSPSMAHLVQGGGRLCF